MSKYAIMRIAKVKSIGSLRGIERHNRREMNVPNADTRGKIERIEPYNPVDLYAKWQEKLGDHAPRKNAVYAYELIMSASPEWWNGDVVQRNVFIHNSVEWLKKTFGESNIVAVDMHRDEKTPHLHAVIIPMKDGKLNARSFTGGRDKMRELQGGYAEQLKAIGLERGIEGSKAKHQDIKRYYSTIKAEQAELSKQVDQFTRRKIRKPSRADIERVLVANQRANEHLAEQQGNVEYAQGEVRELVDQMERQRKRMARQIKEGREAQEKVRELKKDIKERKDYTIKLLHGALKRLGYDSNEELEKQHDIAQERERRRDRGDGVVKLKRKCH